MLLSSVYILSYFLFISYSNYFHHLAFCFYFTEIQSLLHPPIFFLFIYLHIYKIFFFPVSLLIILFFDKDPILSIRFFSHYISPNPTIEKECKYVYLKLMHHNAKKIYIPCFGWPGQTNHIPLAMPDPNQP